MNELYEHQDSVIDKLDARVKLVFTLVFLICLNSLPVGVWPAYILFFALICVEILFSQVSLKKLMLRSLISLPFILAAIPLIFTGPEPYFQLVISSNTWLSISHPGLIHFMSVLIKTWISVLAALLLSTTTSFQTLITAFQFLKVPNVIIAIFSLMWRYLSLMIQEARTLMHARASRSGSTDGKKNSTGSVFWRAKVTGRMTGNLLIRSLERSERVYAAMCSRGHDGELLILNKNNPISQKELIWLFALSMFCILVLSLSLIG